jgi:hypothetical protein
MSIFIRVLVFAAVLVLVQTAFGQRSAVTGYWKNGSVGTIQYKDRVTGSTKPGRGSLFTYKFNTNGTYEFIGYMETTMYNCTTTLFNQITGRYTVTDGRIDLSPAKDLWKSTNSCAASGNRQQTKTPTPKTVDFERRTDEYGGELLCISEGGAESCFRKEKG